MLSAKQQQAYMFSLNAYLGKIDGDFGPKSEEALAATLNHYKRTYLQLHINTDKWSVARQRLALSQMIFEELEFYTGTIDGLIGPNTLAANEQYQNYMRDNDPFEVPDNTQSTVFPVYRDMTQFYGPVGHNINRHKLPYAMRLAWDTDVTVSNISLHDKCADSALGVLEEARDHYGLSGIREGNLHLFGGSLNVRKMRGGSQWSTHSWAAALDIDPSNNQFRWNDDRATLDNQIYDKWWELWEAAGWVSLGRERNYDWMHIQAVRLAG